MWFLFTVLGVLAIAFLVALPILLSRVLFRVFGNRSGLHALMESYPTTQSPVGLILRREWLAVGRVYYGNRSDIAIEQDGLYIHERSLLSNYEPMLIPWADISNPRTAVLALRRAVRFSVGNPQIATLVVTAIVFEHIRPHLSLSQD